MSLRPLIAACAVLLSASVAGAQEWPRFRGPNGSGPVAGASFAGPVAAADVVWRQKLPGTGHSSPVAWADHVYVTAADADSGERWLVCLSADTGKELWRHAAKFISHRTHRDNSFASATPAADDLGAYVVFTSPQECLLAAVGHDGKERWHRSLGRFESQHGGGTSPTVIGDLVVLNLDQEAGESALKAFDRRTGAPVWSVAHRTTRKAAMSTPAVWQPKGGAEQIVCTTWGGGIQGIDPKTGKAAWSAPDVFFSRPIGSPQFAGDLVIGVCGEGNGTRSLVAVRPDPTGAKPPAVAYKIDQLGPHVPCPLVAGDRLVLLNDLGQLTVADVATGNVRWSQKLGLPFYGSPVLAGDVLWAVSRSGTLVGLKLDAEVGKEIARLELGGQSHATPAIVGPRMFLRTTTEVICLKKQGPAAAAAAK
ncbi:MAG TPA: PQQ-binding-like beta-propeller repeat protein [Humisphaera sp.]